MIWEVFYIFVVYEYVLVQLLMVMYMRKCFKVYVIEIICVDKSGYYVIFYNSDWGCYDVECCYRVCNWIFFFNYFMVMEFNIYGLEGRGLRIF